MQFNIFHVISNVCVSPVLQEVPHTITADARPRDAIRSGAWAVVALASASTHPAATSAIESATNGRSGNVYMLVIVISCTTI